jgi:hypothetical protein
MSVHTRLRSARYIPTTLFIDKRGIVRICVVGSHPRQFYFDALRHLGVPVVAR